MNFKVIASSLFLASALSVSVMSCGPKDDAILKEVQTKLATAPSVSASVEKGVVTLTGEFPDEASKAAATAQLGSVKGVKSVVDNSTITPPPPPPAVNPDMVITETINKALAAKGFSGISVSVVNGEVTLTGDAKRADLQAIMKLANEAQVKKVINKLNLK